MDTNQCTLMDQPGCGGSSPRDELLFGHEWSATLLPSVGQLPVAATFVSTPYTHTTQDGSDSFVEFIPGKRYKRKDVHAAIGGQNQSGISTPSKHKIILCFTVNKPEATGYYDALNSKEGIWIFSGEGQNNMTFTRGNLQLRDHKQNNKKVLLFTCDTKLRDVIFEAEVEVANVEVTGVANLLGVPRAAILFHLHRIHSNPVRVDLNIQEATTKKRKPKILPPSPPSHISCDLVVDNPPSALHPNKNNIACTATEAPPTPPISEEEEPHKKIKRNNVATTKRTPGKSAQTSRAIPLQLPPFSYSSPP